MLRRWIPLVLVSGVIAACSGSNENVELGVDAADGGLDATTAVDGAETPTDGATRRDSGKDCEAGGPVDATVDAPAPTPDAESSEGLTDGAGPSDASADGPADGASDGSPSDGSPSDGSPSDGSPSDGASDASSDGAVEASFDAGDATAEAGPSPDAGDASTCPPVSAAAGAYVNLKSGVDDDAHGGGPGGCAYKTITYALAHSDGKILVAKGTYSVAAGETLPLVMTGHQGIYCTNVTISGQGAYPSASASHAAVVLTGTANVVNACSFVGSDLAGSCLLVASTGAGAGHVLENLDATQCGSAAVRVEGSVVAIDQGYFYGNDWGVVWSGTTPTGSMTNNTFSTSAIEDILCSAADPGVTGSNNPGDNGDATCSGCANCPFH